MLMVLLLSVTLVSCSPADQAAMSDLAEKTQHIDKLASEIVNSPPGELLPGSMKLGIAVVAAVISALSNAWLGLANGKYKTALSEVIIGNKPFEPDISFRNSQNASQTLKTRKLINKLKGGL